MPRTNLGTRYADELQKYGTEGSALYDEYCLYMSALRQLAALYDSFMPTDGQEPKKINAENLALLRRAYHNVFSRGNEFLGKAKNNDQIDLTLSTRVALVRNASQAMAEAFTALSAASDNESMTLEEILDIAEGREIKVDVAEVPGVGAANSNRIPVKFATEGGQEVEGFFTEYTDKSFKREMKGLMDRLCGGDKALRNVFNTIASSIYSDKNLYSDLINDPENTILQLIQQGGRRDEEALRHVYARAFPGFDPDMPRMIPQEANASFEYFVTRLGGENQDGVTKLNEKIITLLREAPLIFNRHAIEQAMKLDTQKKREDRNAAMTAVADLLGCPTMLARSTKMTVVLNGERKEGVFMEKAQGEDLNSFTTQSNLANLDKKEPIAPELKKKIADLQVIDYLCGNPDRHHFNLLYKVENRNGKNQVVDFMGIDNDSCLGKLGPHDIVGMSDVPLELMGCVSKSMSAQLKVITPEILEAVLKNYHITSKEITCAKQRLGALKAAISKKQIKVLSDEQLKTAPMNKLARVYGRIQNQFARIGIGLQKHVRDWAKENENAPNERRTWEDFSKRHSYYHAPENKNQTQARGAVLLEGETGELSYQKMRDLHQEIVTTTAFFGTEEYDTIAKDFKALAEATRKMTVNTDFAEWKRLQLKCDVIKGKVEKYLKRKEDEGVEKMKKGKTLSETAKSRKLVMSNLRKYLESKSHGIEAFMKRQKNEPIHHESMEREVREIEQSFARKPFDHLTCARWIVKKQIMSLEKEYQENEKEYQFTRQDEINALERLAKSPAYQKLWEDCKGKKISLASIPDMLELEMAKRNTDLDHVLDLNKEVLSFSKGQEVLQ